MHPMTDDHATRSDRSDKETALIQNIAKDIKSLSADVKMLAINAAIEAAHATVVIEKLTEAILDDLMTTHCKILAELLCIEKFRSSTYLQDFARRTNISEIWVTDEEGVVEYSTNDDGIGWQFPKDPTSQTFAFFAVVGKEDHVVCQKLQNRSIDNQVFKYVGVSRLDKAGIVQVGLNADNISAFRGETREVFSVIAREISDVSVQVSDKADELSAWVRRYLRTQSP
jgi:hypothetical protein